ncbi:retinol dehydrogenase [Mactra antiquata]
MSILQYLSKLELPSQHKRHVLITGCDTGFGNILARSLDKQGVPVLAGCLTEQGAEKLKKETSSRLKTLVIDVTNEQSIKKAVEFVQKNVPTGELWGLVNNAGIMPTYGPVEWTTMKEFELTCRVNLFGTVAMTMAFLPMLRASRGRLVNMCSVTSNCGYPGIANYVVSKAGVKMFTVSLRRELYNTGITTHTIEPGGFNTNITDKQRLMDIYCSGYLTANQESRDFYGGDISKYLLNGINQTTKYVNTTPHTVADAMKHALLAKYPNRSYLLGLDAHLFFRMLKLLPEWAADMVIGWPKPFGKICPEFEDFIKQTK